MNHTHRKANKLIDKSQSIAIEFVPSVILLCINFFSLGDFSIIIYYRIEYILRTIGCSLFNALLNLQCEKQCDHISLVPLSPQHKHERN